MPGRKPIISRADRDALRALLTETSWIQHARARSATGRIVDPSSSSAFGWCIYGAAMRTGGHRLVQRLAVRIREQDADGRWQEPDDGCLLFGWNDAEERTFACIQALIG